MASAIPADAVSFVATAIGTVDFQFAAARPSWVTPSQSVTLGDLVDGQLVPYFAQDDQYSPVQREWGIGTYVNATQTIQRTTPQGGVDLGNTLVLAGSKVSFQKAPIVSIGPITANVVTGTCVPGTSQTVIGGTGAGSTLTLQSTSGTRTTDIIVFQTGSQTTAVTVRTDQSVLFKSPIFLFDTNGGAQAFFGDRQQYF